MLVPACTQQVGKMNTLLRGQIFLFVVLSFVGGGNAAYASIGKWLYESNHSIEVFVAGLDENTATVDGEGWLYYVKNDAKKGAKHKSCTVLIHGFAAEASHWLRFVSKLKHDQCVIVPDLPGFGRSSFVAAGKYSIVEQVKRLQRFLTQLQLASTYHFVGSSMGGQIAGMYAVKFPEDVASLVLINAGGVLSPAKSDMDLQLEKTGKSIFDVESTDEYRAMFNMTMSDPPWMPDVVMEHLSKSAIERNKRNRAIFQQVYQQDLLDDHLNKIVTPTLILWGAEDRLLHSSMANVFHKGIVGSTLIVIPDLGHLPFLEQPGDTAQLFDRFIADLLK